MREFSAEYLQTTREGMWEGSREVLSPLGLDTCERVLDVGAGTGALTRVLREETPGKVVALDADGGLLANISGSRVQGDATRLPFADDSFDVVVCQALLVNLPDPKATVREFARVSRGRVAAIEPDNSAVRIDSTVEAEAPLARRARKLYLQGVETDASLGAARAVFSDAGLDDISVGRYDHERTIEPPYDEYALRAAQRKASGEGLTEDRETVLAGETTAEEFDALRQEWREMGRTVVEQMQASAYRQREVVPFFVTVGRV
ncbi:class I SAM-dependent methyltransferase [Salinibaculum rarum]|uniref:class I SAM-dependent methyltransferase n=1 Tax=Salinibaculum rarum TaxID=3058903 RepID=UPI0034E93AA8